jgi:hypothetical protein
MAKWLSRFSWRPTPATLVAGVLITVGLILSDLNQMSLCLVALGTFGPGILRELGWLKDQDEFQRKAAWRAGYHAFLAGGFITFIIVAYLRSGERSIGDPVQMVTMILAILWFTWLFSSLLAYWGTQRTASRILIIFGIVWLTFIILSTHDNVLSLLMHSIVAVPFFALAYSAKRWPRITGFLLLAAGVFFFYRFRLYEIFSDSPLEKGRGTVIVFFLGPFIASGIALLSMNKRIAAKQDEEN